MTFIASLSIWIANANAQGKQQPLSHITMFFHPPFSLFLKSDFAIVFPFCTFYTKYIDKCIHTCSLLFPSSSDTCNFLVKSSIASFFVTHLKVAPIMHM